MLELSRCVYSNSRAGPSTRKLLAGLSTAFIEMQPKCEYGGSCLPYVRSCSTAWRVVNLSPAAYGERCSLMSVLRSPRGGTARSICQANQNACVWCNVCRLADCIAGIREAVCHAGQDDCVTARKNALFLVKKVLHGKLVDLNVSEAFVTFTV